jgi:hypothetical protein
MAPYGCGCEPLCNECFAEHLTWFTGVAQSRGESWARAIANVIPIDGPWPRTEKMRAGALRKVADLTDDARLRERLADEVVIGAERWWNRALNSAG